MRKSTKPESFSESFADEEKLPLSIAARLAFGAHHVRPPSRVTLFRWIRKGKFGVRLQSRRFNGSYQTSVEAINRFIQAVDRASENASVKKQRRLHEPDHISQELDRLGLK